MAPFGSDRVDIDCTDTEVFDGHLSPPTCSGKRLRFLYFYFYFFFFHFKLIDVVHIEFLRLLDFGFRVFLL